MPRSAETPPTIYELRELWRRYRGNGVVQRAILEIQHLRRFLCEVEHLRAVIQRCWYAEAECQLVALEELRCDLKEEMFRAGVVTDEKVRPLPPHSHRYRGTTFERWSRTTIPPFGRWSKKSTMPAGSF